jgi:hypothetical protein
MIFFITKLRSLNLSVMKNNSAAIRIYLFAESSGKSEE